MTMDFCERIGGDERRDKFAAAAQLYGQLAVFVLVEESEGESAGIDRQPGAAGDRLLREDGVSVAGGRKGAGASVLLVSVHADEVAVAARKEAKSAHL